MYLHNQPKCSVVSHVIVVVVGFDFDYFGPPIILGRTRYHRLLHQHVDVEFRAHVGQADAHKLILAMLQASRGMMLNIHLRKKLSKFSKNISLGDVALPCTLVRPLAILYFLR